METVAVVIAGVQAAVRLAPGVVDVVKKAKDLVTSLFAAGVITKEQQDKVFASVDAVCEVYRKGEIPPEMAVEPDPQA